MVNLANQENVTRKEEVARSQISEEQIRNKAEAIGKLLFQNVELKRGGMLSPEAGRSMSVGKSESQSMG